MTLTTEQVTQIVAAFIVLIQAVVLYYTRKTNGLAVAAVVQAGATHALVNSQTAMLLVTTATGAHAEGMLAQQSLDKGISPAAVTPTPITPTPTTLTPMPPAVTVPVPTIPPVPPAI